LLYSFADERSEQRERETIHIKSNQINPSSSPSRSKATSSPPHPYLDFSHSSLRHPSPLLLLLLLLLFQLQDSYSGCDSFPVVQQDFYSCSGCCCSSSLASTPGEVEHPSPPRVVDDEEAANEIESESVNDLGRWKEEGEEGQEGERRRRRSRLGWGCTRRKGRKRVGKGGWEDRLHLRRRDLEEAMDDGGRTV
jgi:hypothetical protein